MPTGDPGGRNKAYPTSPSQMMRAVCLVALFACGSGSRDTVAGRVAGISFNNVQTAAFAEAVFCGPAPVPFVVVVDLSDDSRVCPSAQAGEMPGRLAHLSIALQTRWLNPGVQVPPFDSPPIGPGTYDIGVGTADVNGFVVVVSADIDSTDASCASVIHGPILAASGTVVLTNVSSTRISGSFNFVFGSTGETMTGFFDDAPCPAPPSSLCAQACGI
jgi:hypothetical protein